MLLRLVGIFALASTVLAACSTTTPLNSGPQYVAMKKQFDTMAPSGRLTFKDATKFHKQLFSSSDANGDGRLSQSEFPDLLVIPPETKQTGLDRFDRNRDQHLAEDEFLVHVNRLFLRDWNSDGVLTFQERTTYQTASKPPPPTGFQRRPNAGPGRTVSRPGTY